MKAELASELSALISDIGEDQTLDLIRAARSGNAEFAAQAIRIVSDEIRTLRAVAKKLEPGRAQT